MAALFRITIMVFKKVQWFYFQILFFSRCAPYSRHFWEIKQNIVLKKPMDLYNDAKDIQRDMKQNMKPSAGAESYENRHLVDIDSEETDDNSIPTVPY